MTRSAGRTRFLEFDSYANRYAANGLTRSWPREAQPYYPWSPAWRAGPQPDAVTAFLPVAHELAVDRGWLAPAGLAAGPLWLPPDDPTRGEVGPRTG